MKITNNKWIIISSILITIGFTFWGIQEWFSFIIVDLLGKNTTMTGRTNIWQIGLNGFYENPLLGKGFNVMTIDNGIIQILYRGGILGLLSLIIFLYVATTFVRKKKNFSLENFFSIMISIILIMSITESWFFFFGFYIIMILAYNIKQIYNNVDFFRK